ncbi:hypothetical protein Taro_055494, partial [Colocasia esculenta]|nr:hypothetical protein [Colocasia esculenta]
RPSRMSGAYNIDATWSVVAFLLPDLRGGVIVELRPRKRWPFRREGPNGSALLLEVGTLDSSRETSQQWQGAHREEETGR